MPHLFFHLFYLLKLLVFFCTIADLRSVESGERIAVKCVGFPSRWIPFIEISHHLYGNDDFVIGQVNLFGKLVRSDPSFLVNREFCFAHLRAFVENLRRVFARLISGKRRFGVVFSDLRFVFDDEAVPVKLP